MLKKFAIGCVSFFALMSSNALAEPIKIESDNIIFYGDASPKLAKRIVEKMEIYRKLIMTLSGVDPRPDEEKLTIYALDQVGDLEGFTGMRGVAGVYTYGYDGPQMLTPLRGAMNQDNFNNQVALHEYSHHVLHGYMETAYPRWYDEGFANYLSTFTLSEDGVIQVGRAAAKHAEQLLPGRLEWVDVEDVISAIRVYPFADKGSKRGILLNQFYAQSWLYVHYLHSNRELSMRLGDYLDLVNSGEEPLAAFEKGFGISPKDFHEAAEDYWKANKFKVQQFQPKAEFMNVPLKVEKISKPELNLQMALGQRAFLGKKNANSYAKKLNSYENKIGQTAESLAARASYFITKEDYEQAALYAKSALGQNPQSVKALRMIGDVYFHKSHAELFEDLKDTDPRLFTLNEEMKQAINYFDLALEKSPNDYLSVTHMVSVYGASDIPLTPSAYAAALTFEARYWDANNVSGTLNLANIHLKRDNISRACDYFETAKKQAENNPNRDKSALYNRVKGMMKDFSAKCGPS